MECSESSDQEEVLLGDDICFGSWDEEANRIDFGSKMGTNVEMFFVPDDTDSFPVQSAYLHTSCSKPIYPSWAAVFAEDCDSSEASLVNLDEVLAGSLGFCVAFVDGVSRGYYKVAKELSDETGISFFDVNFVDCGCNCDATAFPTSFPLPSSSQNEAPVGSPTGTFGKLLLLLHVKMLTNFLIFRSLQTCQLMLDRDLDLQSLVPDRKTLAKNLLRSQGR